MEEYPDKVRSCLLSTENGNVWGAIPHSSSNHEETKMNEFDVYDEVKHAKKILKELAESGDYEVAHAHADDLLCDVLRTMGHHSLVDAYEKVGKWYA